MAFTYRQDRGVLVRTVPATLPNPFYDRIKYAEKHAGMQMAACGVRFHEASDTQDRIERSSPWDTEIIPFYEKVQLVAQMIEAEAENDLS